MAQLLQVLQLPMEPIPARAGFVDELEPTMTPGQAANQLHNCFLGVRDRAECRTSPPRPASATATEIDSLCTSRPMNACTSDIFLAPVMTSNACRGDGAQHTRHLGTGPG